ncbi:MAG: hypothetical protein N3F66_13035, partial [Spirochaetes bacterium]|nr:hypothetical protein [Spirochaetota bacterium]
FWRAIVKSLNHCHSARSSVCFLPEKEFVAHDNNNFVFFYAIILHLLLFLKRLSFYCETLFLE